jgi:hypothetical protein
MQQEWEVAPMKAMHIGEVARCSGVGIETIRYYEREGLLHEPQRRPSGYRLYDAATLERLEYICRAKELKDRARSCDKSGLRCGTVSRRRETVPQRGCRTMAHGPLEFPIRQPAYTNGSP